MELTLFIDRILTENNKPCTDEDVKKVENYIFQKARTEAKGKGSIGIDDETIKSWVLEYEPGKTIKKEKVEPKDEEKKADEKPSVVYKPIEKRPKKIKKDDSKGTWGQQESLF